MLSLKDEYALRFINFVIIGLRNYFANCWFSRLKLTSVLVSLAGADLSASVADFLSKYL